MTWTFPPARQTSSPSTTNSIRSSTQTQRPKSFPLKSGLKPAHSTNPPLQDPASHTSSNTWYSKELTASLAKRYHRRFRPLEASGTPTPPSIVLFTISMAPLSHSTSSFPRSSKWSSARLFPRDEYEKEKDVIRREIAMGLDDPDSVSSQLLFRTCYQRDNRPPSCDRPP